MAKNEDENEEYKLLGNVDGKRYEKVRAHLLTHECYILADGRMTSMRQQSELLLLVLNRSLIFASPLTIYRRIKVRMKALALNVDKLSAASALQLCYDGRVVNRIDRYVFLDQFIDDKLKRSDSVMHVKSFPKDKSVTAEAVFALSLR